MLKFLYSKKQKILFKQYQFIFYLEKNAYLFRIEKTQLVYCLKVAFCQKVRCGSKKCVKQLFRAENLNKLLTVIGRKFKFTAQDSPGSF